MFVLPLRVQYKIMHRADRRGSQQGVLRTCFTNVSLEDRFSVGSGDFDHFDFPVAVRTNSHTLGQVLSESVRLRPPTAAVVSQV